MSALLHSSLGGMRFGRLQRLGCAGLHGTLQARRQRGMRAADGAGIALGKIASAGFEALQGQQ
jgi:hypothetical protein